MHTMDKSARQQVMPHAYQSHSRRCLMSGHTEPGVSERSTKCNADYTRYIFPGFHFVCVLCFVSFTRRRRTNADKSARHQVRTPISLTAPPLINRHALPPP